MTVLWRALLSMRTTAAILGLVCMLLLLNVALPQAHGATAAAYQELVARSSTWRFLLVTLELGRLPTSRVFLVTVCLFFLNLALVLAERSAAILRRIRARPPGPAQLAAWVERGSVVRALPAGAAPPRPAEVLRALGYRTAGVGDGAVWGVRNATALLGVVLFHASFFVLCAGGALLWATRSEATLAGAEGQVVDARAASPLRRAPFPSEPALSLSVERVEVELEDGKPTALSVALRPAGPLEPVQVARVNHPVRYGPVSVLVERAGVAPVLRLRDAAGLTVDRAVVMTSGVEEGRAPLADGALEVRVAPHAMGPRFPARAALPSFPVGVRVLRGGEPIFAGTLRPGEAARVGAATLQLEEVRYWAGLRLVSERGGGLLVAGFVAGVLGLAWRMLLPRREVAVLWDERGLQVAGRSERHPERLRGELEQLADLLVDPRAARAAERSSA